MLKACTCINTHSKLKWDVGAWNNSVRYKFSTYPVYLSVWDMFGYVSCLRHLHNIKKYYYQIRLHIVSDIYIVRHIVGYLMVVFVSHMSVTGLIVRHIQSFYC